MEDTSTPDVKTPAPQVDRLPRKFYTDTGRPMVKRSLDARGAPRSQMLSSQLAYLDCARRDGFKGSRDLTRIRPYLKLLMFPARRIGGCDSYALNMNKRFINNYDVEWAVIGDRLRSKRWQTTGSTISTIGMSITTAKIIDNEIILDLKMAESEDKERWRQVTTLDLCRFPRRRFQLMEENQAIKDTTLDFEFEHFTLERGEMFLKAIQNGSWNVVIETNRDTFIAYRFDGNDFLEGRVTLPDYEFELDEVDPYLAPLHLGQVTVGLPTIEVGEGVIYDKALFSNISGRVVRRDPYNAVPADFKIGDLAMEQVSQVCDHLESSLGLPTPVGWEPLPRINYSDRQFDAVITESIENPSFQLKKDLIDMLNQGRLGLVAAYSGQIERIGRLGNSTNMYISYGPDKVQPIPPNALLLTRGPQGYTHLSQGMQIEEGTFIGFYVQMGFAGSWSDLRTLMGDYMRFLVEDFFYNADIVESGIGGWDEPGWLVPYKYVQDNLGDHCGLYWDTMPNGESNSLYYSKYNALSYPVKSFSSEVPQSLHLAGMRINL